MVDASCNGEPKKDTVETSDSLTGVTFQACKDKMLAGDSTKNLLKLASLVKQGEYDDSMQDLNRLH